jgi:hypothetical protein
MIVAALAVTTFAAHAAKKPQAKFDPPDLNLEYQLHRQFLKSTGRLGNVHPQGLTESYALQKGETLWTLSEMLYGDGQYWPRVWAQNKGISNPHLVRPGHQLQFLMGSEDDTPAFRFSEGGDEPSGLERTAGPAQNPIVEIPPPEVPPKPILKVPSSFPEWQSVYKKKPDKFIDDRGIVANRAKIPDRIWLRGYVQENSVEEESVGKFLENDNEAGLPITNQYVYVKIKKGAGHQGMKMLVVADGGKLKRLNRQWDPDERPWLVQITAEIELREQTPARFRGSDKEEYDAYRALVTKTTGLSAKECFIIPGELQSISLNNTGNSGTTESQVIGSEKHGASALFAPGDLVFLSKGTSDGVEVDQMFDVFADRSIRRSQAVVTLSPVTSATIKVVRASSKVATAVLLSAFDSVQQGDIARQVTMRRDGGERLDAVNMKGGPSSADDDQIGGDEGGGDQLPLEEDLENEIDSGDEF